MKMKAIWKRALALGLAGALAAGCMAGCGGKGSEGGSAAGDGGSAAGSGTAAEGDAAAGGSTEDGAASGGTANDGEITEVCVMIQTLFGTDGAQEVEDAVNAVTEEKYGLRFKITMVDMGNIAQHRNLALAGDDVDILQVVGLQRLVSNGQITNLEPYWENASPKIRDLIDPNWIDACRVNGNLYGLPKLVDFGHISGLVIDEEIAAEYGFTDLQHVTMEEIDEFLAWAKEHYPDRYPLAPYSSYIAADTDWTWDKLGDKLGVLPDCGQGSTTVESLMDNEDFIELVNWCQKWYQAGYVTPDILSNTESPDAKIANGQAVSRFKGYGPSVYEGQIRTVVVDHWTDSSNIALATYAINANSKHKDAAWKAMEILYTDPEVGTYIYNGIEGRDYVKNDDGTISWPEGLDESTVPYGQAGIVWVMPWVQNGGIPFQADGPDYYDRLLEYDREGTFSQALGFMFDPGEVMDEYTACSNVMEKYYMTLLSGAVDVDSTLEKARKEFEDAGLDKVIAEKQRQLDAFLAEKQEAE